MGNRGSKSVILALCDGFTRTKYIIVKEQRVDGSRYVNK